MYRGCYSFKTYAKESKVFQKIISAVNQDLMLCNKKKSPGREIHKKNVFTNSLGSQSLLNLHHLMSLFVASLTANYSTDKNIIVLKCSLYMNGTVQQVEDLYPSVV